MGRTMIAVGFAAQLVGCGSAAFHCEDDAQCGPTGVCHLSGYCAFPDEQCPSDYRFGSHAPDDLAGQCVPPSTADGTTSETTDSAETASAGGSTATSADPSGATTNDATTADATTADATTSAVDDTSGSAGASTTEPSGTATTTTGGDGSTTTQGQGGTTSGAATDASSGSSTGENLDPDLVLWYRFDDPLSDGPEDSTASLLHGSCDACPAPVPGVFGDAASFDGSTQWIEVPQSTALDLTEEFTVAVWVRHDQWLNGYDAIATRPYGASVYDSWQISTYTTDTGSALRLVMVDANGTIYTHNEPTEEVTDVWVHLALVWDGAAARTYRNGQLHIEEAVPSVAYDNHSIRLGSDFDNDVANHFFPGALDDFRIYARALTQDEIDVLATP